MTRRVPGLILLPLVVIAVFSTGCELQQKSTPVSPSAPTVSNGGTATSYVGTWASAVGISSLSADKCGNFQWNITSQTQTSIAGDVSATCGSLGIAATGTATLNGQDVALKLKGTVSASGFPVCNFDLTGNGTIQGDTLPLTYSGTTCLGPVSGTETLKKGGGSSTPVTFNAPAVVSPKDNNVVSSMQPTLTLTNATRSGSPGVVAYRIQVSTDSGFGSGVLQWQVPEGQGQTSLIVPQPLATGSTFYWRAMAYEGSNEGPWSGSGRFQTPSSAPAPTPGPAGADQMNMSQATILNSPSDLASWPITTSLEVVDMGPGGIAVQFSKKDGPGRWPDVTPPGWDGPLQYTLGMCMVVNNRWYCSAVVEFWYGLNRSGGAPQDYAMNWFYDPIRWAPMTGHQPAVGETIGIFVCAGDCRNNTKGTLSPVAERSNVVLVKQPGSGGAVYRF
jgi:hypothetical protein